MAGQRVVKAEFGRYLNLGLSTKDGGWQRVFALYAWDEFGEGGTAPPTWGRAYRNGTY